MIRGSCLCGGVKFEIERATGPFELCHCTRCRKVSGSAYLTWLGVRREGFRFLQGEDLIRTYECPVRESPPPYDTSFCSRCGSQVPNPSKASDPWFEIPAGALEDDPRIRPDKHIYVEFGAPWDHIADDLPQMTKGAISARRASADMEHPLVKLIAAYGQAWNRHDIEGILAMHTEDSVFENHTSGGKGVGKEAIREILEGVFAAFPDIQFEARRTYARDGLVTQEWTATGTLAVPYSSGGVTVQPTGRKVSWNGVDVIPFAGALIARKDVYVDSIGFLRALGFPRIDL